MTTVFESLEPRRLFASTLNSYTQTNLISDGTIAAQTTDPHLVNAWGLSIAPGHPAWVANNGTATSTAYQGHTIIPPTINIPKGSAAAAALPAGITFNNTNGFRI